MIASVNSSVVRVQVNCFSFLIHINTCKPDVCLIAFTLKSYPVNHLLFVADMSMRIICSEMYVELRMGVCVKENRTDQNRGKERTEESREE